MSATDIAAWWGAGIATVVLLFDVFKWWHGLATKVRVSANPNMQMIDPERGELVDPKMIFVEAVNTGDRKTIVTHLVGYYYCSLWRRIIRRPTQPFLVPDPMYGRLPADLEPGDRWQGQIEQTEQIEDWSRSGRLYVGINHSLRKKAKLVRVKIPETGDD